ncbi:hypothetical protein TNCV_3517351 [Trichonephila clavipes]|nr:hypothetical protein TNCV_3517351 [Trichonephila clavipes]
MSASFRLLFDISVIPCSCRPRVATTNISNSCSCGLEHSPSARNDTFVDSQLCSYTGDSSDYTGDPPPAFRSFFHV